ncbi:PAS domain-containing sensor histidine kinase [Alicyclobacillus fastidiosus]|uniref:histidine kinase n=1 Tax=Alicyclobacillus fastidiosus TaxID=392011 RepID=A0ABV5AJP9_9BACL|nr:PAS domain-containing sensor histidine kinase [Alicyclobacillus fastidiosus]WEH08006.1 PAS domain S-box protein [Alicyclobacillus fastidiosus]
MDNRYFTFVSRSRHWTRLVRGSHLFQQATGALADIVGVDTGFILYQKQLFLNEPEPLRVYGAWGALETFLGELRNHHAEEVESRIQDLCEFIPPGWSQVEHLRSPIQAVCRAYGMYHIGVWPLHIEQKQVGVVVLGSLQPVLPPHWNDMYICIQQIELVLEVLYARRLSEMNRQQFQSLVENNPDIIYQTDVAGNLVYANASFQEITGYRLEDLQTRRSRRALIVSEHMEKAASHRAKVLSGLSQSLEIAIHNQQGRRVHLSINSVPVMAEGVVTGIFAIAKDLTGHIEAQRELSAAKGLYESFISSSADGIAVIDRDGRYLRVNAAFEQMYGCTKAELVGQYRPFYPDAPESEMWVRLALQGETVHAETGRFGKDGQWMDISVAVSPVIDNQGDVIAISSISRDITERKRAEMALIEAETKYRTIVEESLVGVYIIEDNIYRFVNPKMAEIFGYGEHEMIGLHAWDLVTPEDLELCKENVRKRIDGEVESIRYQMKGRRKDGTVIDIEVHGTRTSFHGKPVIIGTLLDVTERTETEELIRKADKLAVVGQLAAGVAHEIRNPLTALKGFVQLLAEDRQNGRYCDIMLSELNRINRIIDELLLAAKPSLPTFERKNVSDILSDVLSLMSTQCVIKNINVSPLIHQQVPAIHCDANQMKQVFLNVLKNAVEAVPVGGEIQVSVLLQDVDHVMIRIADNGPGIPEDRLPKLGEPFYTNKDTGTGLGLMVSYRIVETHRGSMKIQSHEGTGTTVDIVLPIEQERSQMAVSLFS